MNKLLINEKYIEIVCKRGDDETLALARQIPYIHENRIKTKFRTTARNIDLVLKLFRGVDERNIHTAPQRVQDIYNKEMQRRIDTAKLLKEGPLKPRGWLFKHQQLGRELAEVNDRYAFFYDTRTGKTPMSLQIIADDIEKNPDHKWLILCPLILIENAWLEDAAKFFPDMSVVNLWAPTKQKRLKQYKKKANVYITNIESFITYRKYVEELDIHGCFVDESSTMKSHRSKFGKAAVDYARGLKRWYLLSGTPAPNGEWEYYRQIQSVDYYGVHKSWTQFKEYFFDNVSYNPQFEKLQVKPHKHEELMSLLKRYSIYIDKEDVLQTPGREFVPVEFNMPSKLSEKYHQLRTQLYLELEENDALITAPSAAAKINKLNQVTSGFVIDTRTEDTHLLSDYRFKELDKILYNIGDEQAIIWCNYRKEFELLKLRLGDKCACVYGVVGIEDKNKNIKAFKDGDVQYLIANPASADKGLTLTNAHYAIYFSLGYSYELFKQSIERIYGDVSKQNNKCTYYILIAKGTVDKAIYNAVRSKGDMSIAVLNHLKGGSVDVDKESR